MTTKHTTTTAMALCLAALALPAFAQEAPTETLYLGRIIIGYTDDGTPVYAGENTSYIESDELRAAGGTTSMDEILRRQTSVFTQEDPGNPGIAVNIRGFEGSGRVAMMIDGVPQNYRMTGHAAQGGVFVDANFLAAVDITRGAVVTAGGSGIAGAVNFKTINPEDLVLDGQGWGSLARLSYGDNGQNASGMVSTAYMDSRFGALIALSGNTARNYEDGDGTPVANTGPNANSQLVKLTYNLTDTQSLRFSAMRYSTDFFATSYHQDLSNNVFTLGYGFDPGDGIWDMDINLYFARTDVEWLCCSISSGRQMQTETAGFNVTNVSEFTLDNWDLISVNGIDFSRDSLDGTRGGVNPTDGTNTRAALFTENVFTSGNWEITAGLRGNLYKVEGDASQGVVDQEHTSLDPKLTVAYMVNDWFQPYATVSRAMRSPTLQETMLGGTHPGGGVGMIANPNLRPEVSTGFELGFNIDRAGVFAAGDRLSGRVNYYRMNVEDYIIANMMFTNSFGQTGVAFDNVSGTSETSGLELELDYAFNDWDLGLSYTKNDADLASQVPGLGAGQYLPDSTIALSAARRFMGDQLTVGANYTYVSGGLYTGLYQTTPVQRDESYELVDIFATYKVSDNFVVNAKVTNLFDETYVPWLSSDENGRGRSAYIGAEMRF